MGRRNLWRLGAGLVAVGLLSGLVLAGGPLEPPGPPGVTMKSLDEIEPRIPISSLPFSISQRGSYYLTRDLTGVAGQDGIRIEANDVTIDLNGFALIGVPSSGSGVLIGKDLLGPIVDNIALRNGTIRNWGSSGVRRLLGQDLHLRDLRVLSNGSLGIVGGSRCMLINCMVRGNGNGGVLVSSDSAIIDSAILENLQWGITAGDNCSVSRCVVTKNGGSGIRLGSRCRVNDCVASFNSGHGIELNSDNYASGNVANSNSGQHGHSIAGIVAHSQRNRIEGNTMVGNVIGIRVLPSNGKNLVLRNSAGNNTLVNYDIAPGNIVGPIVNSLNISTNTSPHANYAQ